jgi:hypothetical protein
MTREPVDIEFVLKGGIEQEIDKVKVSVQSLGKEGTSSYRNLLNASNEAFNSLSKDAQMQATVLQEVIMQIKQTEQMQASLQQRYEEGEISASQYAEATARLSVEKANLQSQASGLSASIQREIEQTKMVEGSYNQMVARLNELKEAYKNLSEEERNNAEIGGSMLEQIRTLDSETSKLQQTIEGATGSNEGLLNSLRNAPGVLGSTVSGIEAMIKASLRFIATPLGAVITAIVVALKALFTWFKRTEEGQNELIKVTGYFKQILDSLLDVVDRVGERLFKAFTDPKQAMIDLVNFMKDQLVNRFEAIGKMGAAIGKIFTSDWKQGLFDLNNAVMQFASGVEDAGIKLAKFAVDTNEKMNKRAELEDKLFKLRIAERKLNEEIAANEIKIAEYREKAYDVTVSEHERLEAIKMASKLIDENYSKQIKHLEEKRNIQAELDDLADNTIEDNEKISQMNVDIMNLQAQRANEQRMLLRQQNMLNNAVSNEKNGHEKIVDELKNKKEAYQLYYKTIAATNKATAKSMFADLMTSGESYLEYLNRQISALQNKTKLNADDTTRLTLYISERSELTGGTNSIDALKKEIEEKKKLYGDDILSFKQYLKEKRQAIEEDLSEEGYQQKVIVDVELQASDEAYNQKLNELLKQYGGYTVKMLSLTNDYQNAKKILEKAGTKEAQEALENLTAEYNNAVLQLKNSSDNFLKNIFGDIERMGYSALEKLREQTKSVIESARETSDNGQTFMIVDIQDIDEQGNAVKRQVKLTVEEFSKLQKKYTELYNRTEDKNPFKAVSEGFKEVIKAIESGDSDEILNALEKFGVSAGKSTAIIKNWGESLGQIFGQDVSDAVNVISGLSEGMVNLGMGVAQIASGDVIGGISNTLKGVAGIYTTLTAGAKKYHEEQKAWTNELIRFQITYNKALNEQIRTQMQSNVFIKDYVQDIQNAFTAIGDAQQNIDELLSGKSLDKFLYDLDIKIGVAKKKFLGITIGTKNVYGDLGKYFSQLTGSDFSNLIDSSGKLNTELAKTILSLEGITDETKNALEELISYQEQIDSATEQINSAISSIAGSIGSDLYNSLRDAWEGGTDSFSAFKESVSKGIEDIVSQIVFNEIFAEQFGQLQDNLKKSFSVGGDQTVLDDFSEFMGAAPVLVGQWEQAMNDFNAAAEAAGFDLKKGTSAISQTAEKSGITTISEETGTKLEGHFVAVRIYSGKLSESAESILGITVKNQLHLAAIERNTNELSRLERIENSIKLMETNGIKLKA